MKVLLSNIAKNGHTAWFDPQTKKLEPHCITKQIAPRESRRPPINAAPVGREVNKRRPRIDVYSNDKLEKASTVTIGLASLKD